MTALQSAAALTGPSVTEAEEKVWFTDLHDFLEGLFGADGVKANALAELAALGPETLTNHSLSAAPNTPTSNKLTITLSGRSAALSATNPHLVSFRNATLATGDFTTVPVTADKTLVLSNGSILGHQNARLCPIYVYEIYTGSAVELAVCGSYIGDNMIVTTVAEGGAGAADSLTTLYSATLRSAVPARLVGILWSNQTTAGNWTAAMTEIKLPPFIQKRVGDEVTYHGFDVEYGTLLEDGSNVSRTTYAKLFARIGTTWGVGDGSTTFGIPDSRRRVAVGSGGSGTATLGNTLGDVGGEESHTPILSETAAHDHQSTDSASFVTGGAGSAVPGFGTGAQGGLVASTTSAGGGNPFNIMQKSYVVTKSIRWLGDF